MKTGKKAFGLIAVLVFCGLIPVPQALSQRRMFPTPAAPAAPRKGPAPAEASSVTRHQVRIGGQIVNYTATASTYIIPSDEGQPKATFFFVAYTRDGIADPARRPVSFVYNGGPGSASFFTHMGLGPRRVLLTDEGAALPATYTVVENGDSFLDATDLVFIDAVGTGYSRPAPGEIPAQFYGVVQDAEIFADFIYQYLTRQSRWASPKFLIGESYGTTRSAELAGVLQQRHQIYLSGIVLVSAVGFADWGADDRTIFFLPTMVVSARHHKLLPPDLQGLTIEELAQKARVFAHGEYASALEKGDEIPPAEKRSIIAETARMTGLKPSYIEQTNLRINPHRWFKELLRDRRLTVGRLDARFTGMDADAAGESVEYDPSATVYNGAYAAAFHDYIDRELKWRSDLYYAVRGNVRPWDQTGGKEAAEVLRAAMTQQRHLKLLVVCGYYDLATPFNGIETTVSHMMLEPEIRKNVSFAYYEAGHMMYIEKNSREKLHQDVASFIASASRN